MRSAADKRVQIPKSISLVHSLLVDLEIHINSIEHIRFQITQDVPRHFNVQIAPST